MEIIKDDRKWMVKLRLANTSCPYLYFPANYHGCRLLQTSLEHDECTLENCPKRIEEPEGEEK